MACSTLFYFTQLYIIEWSTLDFGMSILYFRVLCSSFLFRGSVFSAYSVSPVKVSRAAKSY